MAWEEAFIKRFTDKRNIRIGGPVPNEGLASQPKVMPERRLIVDTLFNINQEWKRNNLPVTNGILTADGTINRIYVVLDGRKRKLETGGNFELNVLLAQDEIDVVEIAIFKKVEDSKNDITVYCGMGFLGGDGFIVVESKTNSLIKWCAFFEDSNPFQNLEIIGNKIIAYNNLDEKWVFDIHNPVNVSIE